jgi:hypothetical protein
MLISINFSPWYYTCEEIMCEVEKMFEKSELPFNTFVQWQNTLLQ